jgi:hypothetical protein
MNSRGITAGTIDNNHDPEATRKVAPAPNRRGIAVGDIDRPSEAESREALEARPPTATAAEETGTKSMDKKPAEKGRGKKK